MTKGNKFASNTVQKGLTSKIVLCNEKRLMRQKMLTCEMLILKTTKHTGAGVIRVKKCLVDACMGINSRVKKVLTHAHCPGLKVTLVQQRKTFIKSMHSEFFLSPKLQHYLFLSSFMSLS